MKIAVVNGADAIVGFWKILKIIFLIKTSFYHSDVLKYTIPKKIFDNLVSTFPGGDNHCDNYVSFRAPNGCLQYYFGASGGRITSFNSQAAAPQMILNQLYSVCIRQEAGTFSFYLIIFTKKFLWSVQRKYSFPCLFWTFLVKRKSFKHFSWVFH